MKSNKDLNYNIQAVSRLTGIPCDTLRNWEKRYRFLAPIRLKGGDRRYTEKDLALLGKIALLLKQGFRIGDLAELLYEGRELPAVVSTRQSMTSHSEDLYRALTNFDVHRADLILSSFMPLMPLGQVLDQVLAPALREAERDLKHNRIGRVEASFCVNFIRQKISLALAWPSSSLPVFPGKIALATLFSNSLDSELLILSAHLKLKRMNPYFLGDGLTFEEVRKFVITRRLEMLCLRVKGPSSIECAELSRITESTGVRLFISGVPSNLWPTQRRVHFLTSHSEDAAEQISRWFAGSIP